MPGDNEDQQQGGTPDPVEAAISAATAPSLSLTPDMVRNSPEYRTLQSQVREAARAKGRAEADAAAARSEAEQVRQAAEAQRQAALSDQISAILGEDGVEAFNEVAALSETDPVEAARRFRVLAAQFAQSGQAPAAVAAAVAAANGAPKVTDQQQQQTPPPPGSLGVSADAPLGQSTTGTDWDAVTKSASDRYAEIVTRNQDPVTRARVTDRERGEGFMSWLAAAYTKGMKAAGRLPRT